MLDILCTRLNETFHPVFNPLFFKLIFTTRQQGKELSGFRIVFAHSKVSKREPTVFFLFLEHLSFYT